MIHTLKDVISTFLSFLLAVVFMVVNTQKERERKRKNQLIYSFIYFFFFFDW